MQSAPAMVTKKTRIVIIGAGMAGLAAANKLYAATANKKLFEMYVVEGGTRIGGRINTLEFGGDRIEMGATWIHGIGGNPIHKIAEDINALQSEQPWEGMDGLSTEPTTIAEGGFELNQSFVKPVTTLFKNLMDYAQGNLTEQCAGSEVYNYCKPFSKNFTSSGGVDKLSLGCFLRQGLQTYFDSLEEQEELKGYGNWSRKSLADAVFSMLENIQRTYTSASDLSTLDYDSESKYLMFPGDEITIAKGYSSVIESLASVLPTGTIQLGRKVTKIEWQPERHGGINVPNGYGSRPVKLHFSDRSAMSADHVIVTVSLGVLKAGIHEDSGMFSPPLPSSKVQAISRLGFGVVNKLFMQLSPSHSQKDEDEDSDSNTLPRLKMVFHPPDSEFRCKKIPWWIRRTFSFTPIYKYSKVLLSWFAGEEALQLESLGDEEIIGGVSTTISSFLTQKDVEHSSQKLCNANGKSCRGNEVKITKILKSHWGTNPLFLGSYSYVAVGASGDDFDTMAEPLPKENTSHPSDSPPLQILFAGEATHRTNYSTTHGAYFSGLREADRLLQHYECMNF